MKEIILKVVAWDRKTPHNYDQRWINLEGMDAVIDALDDEASEKKRKERPKMSLPRDQWKKLAEDNRKTFLEDFLVALSPTGLGSPKKFFSDQKVAALAEAAEEGRLMDIDRLVTGGVDIDASEKFAEFRVTPLMWVMWAGKCQRDKSGFRRLLKRGADPNRVIDPTWGSDSDKESDVCETIRMYMDYDGWNSWSPIGMAAADKEDSEWLEILLRHGANPNLVWRGVNHWALDAGQTAIFAAIRHGSVKNLDLLIHAGADVNHQDNSGETPLLFALWELNFEEHLKLAGNKLEDDKHGIQYQMIYRLLEAGADYHIEDNGGRDAVSEFVEAIQQTNDLKVDPKSDESIWRNKVLQLLAKKGVDLDAARRKLTEEKKRIATKRTHKERRRGNNAGIDPFRPVPKGGQVPKGGHH